MAAVTEAGAITFSGGANFTGNTVNFDGAAVTNFTAVTAPISYYTAVDATSGVSTNYAVADPTTMTYDGVPLTAGSRVLLKDQALAEENGIYLVGVDASTALVRVTDLAIADEAIANKQVFVTGGSTDGGKSFYISTAPTTLGAVDDDLVWTEVAVIQIVGGSGNPGAPAFSWQADTDTGLYNSGVNEIGVSTGGVLRLTIADALITSAVALTVTTGDLTVTNGSLAITSGNLTMDDGVLYLADAGTAALPALGFEIATTTGIYYDTGVGFTVGAAAVGTFVANGLVMEANKHVTLSGIGQLFLPNGDVTDPAIAWAGGEGIYSTGASGIVFTADGLNPALTLLTASILVDAATYIDVALAPADVNHVVNKAYADGYIGGKVVTTALTTDIHRQKSLQFEGTTDTLQWVNKASCTATISDTELGGGGSVANGGNSADITTSTDHTSVTPADFTLALTHACIFTAMDSTVDSAATPHFSVGSSGTNTLNDQLIFALPGARLLFHVMVTIDNSSTTSVESGLHAIIYNNSNAVKAGPFQSYQFHRTTGTGRATHSFSFIHEAVTEDTSQYLQIFATKSANGSDPTMDLTIGRCRAVVTEL
jgi:hypothetical protein